jgi:hypothetical protein
MQFLSRLLNYFLFIFISLQGYSQVNTDSLYKDLDLKNFKPIDPAIPQNLYSRGFYIRNIIPKKKAKETIELIKVYKDSSSHSRKATIINTGYGNVLAFKEMKTPGFEKVIIFGAWDYYNDSLLIRNDTAFFKETGGDEVELTVVYPKKNDTLTIQYGVRNTRHDFLKNFSYKPALKNYLNWFPDNALDYIETYSLVKKDNVYELVKVNTNKERIQEYEYKDIKEKYARAGLSPFWLALTELSF